MIRIILERLTRDQGTVFSGHETIDVDSPALETMLNGGRGGGPNGDDFTYVRIVGGHIIL
jgi:hypothetical protein